VKPEAGARRLDLDLRTKNDRDRSHLVHRLALLGIDWGELAEATGARGTFHELWDLQWQPEYAVRLIEASMWGTTLVEAGAAYVRDAVAKAEDLGTITRLVEATLLAELPEATADVMRAFQQRAAVGTDVPQLMDALPPLARVVRYGNVRDTDVEAVSHVVDGLVVRITVGLAGAVSSLDDDAAQQMTASVSSVHGALALVDRDDLRGQWERALDAVAEREDVHGLVAGRAARLLMDAGTLPADQAARRFSLALSPGTDTARAAAWIEGFLAGGGLARARRRAPRCPRWLGRGSRRRCLHELAARVAADVRHLRAGRASPDRRTRPPRRADHRHRRPRRRPRPRTRRPGAAAARADPWSTT
jgi:Family of unknown function (DUF5682)